MAQKISRGKRKTLGIALKPHEGLWIDYQLRLAGLRQTDIAVGAGVSLSLVTQFLKGKKNSERTKGVLCAALGYDSWDSLIAAARRNTHERVAA